MCRGEYYGQQIFFSPVDKKILKKIPPFLHEWKSVQICFFGKKFALFLGKCVKIGLSAVTTPETSKTSYDLHAIP